MSEPETRLLQVASDAAADRLDRVLARAFGDLSRSRLQALVRDGRVKVAGAVVRESSARVQPGAEIVLEIPAAAPAEPRGEPIALAVVYEDDDIIVIDKPAGLVVHPAAGHDSGTLVNALIAHCGESLSGIGGVKRPGIVHRLDKDTSGLLVVAKTDRAHRGLAAQFADHGRTGALERAYLALVWGVPDPTARRRRRRRSPAAPRTARKWRSSPTIAAATPSRIMPWRRCSAPPRARGELACAARWRPAARTRSGSIWRRSATRCSATRATGPGSRPRRSGFRPRRARRFAASAARLCTPPCSGSSTR